MGLDTELGRELQDILFRIFAESKSKILWRRLERLLITRNLTFAWSETRGRPEVHVKDEYFSQKGFTMENLQSLLRQVNKLQLAMNRWREDRFLLLGDSLSELPPSMRNVLVKCQTTQSPSEDRSVDSYAVVAAAAVLLLSVYHYLTGHADRGGSKVYSSGSLDFRDTYIPIILFHGAYVWIKSRDVAPKGVLPRKSRDKDGNIRVRFEPRFKPSHPKDEPSRYIYVGRYDTPEEASIVYQITAFCYHGRGGLLQLEDGNSLTIPPMTESDRRLTGEAKRKCVKAHVMRVYEALKAERANAAQPRELQAVGVDHTISVCLNSAGATYGAPLPVTPTHNPDMGNGPCGNHCFDTFCEMCTVGSEFSIGDGFDTVYAQASRVAINIQEGTAPSITQMYDHLLQIGDKQLRTDSLVGQLVEENFVLRQQLYFQHQELQDVKTKLAKLQNPHGVQHQELQQWSFQSFPMQYDHPLQEQLQDIDHGDRILQEYLDPSLIEDHLHYGSP